VTPPFWRWRVIRSEKGYRNGASTDRAVEIVMMLLSGSNACPEGHDEKARPLGAAATH